jgi:hypothetical protein
LRDVSACLRGDVKGPSACSTAPSVIVAPVSLAELRVGEDRGTLAYWTENATTAASGEDGPVVAPACGR